MDWWRVEEFVPNQRLLLSAEMKTPGRAWLAFDVERQDERSIIRSTAIFDPVGLSGLLYWYLTYPIHRLIFAKMLDAIGAAAEKEHAGSRAMSRTEPSGIR